MYININGLKRKNNLRGHTAGNRPLKSFSRSLDIFTKRYGFKAVRLFSVDEFLLVTIYPTKGWQAVLEELKVEGNEDCRFAYGVGSSQEIAEENMREDKNNYYDLRPELDRRTDSDRRKRKELQERKLVLNTDKIYTLSGQRVKVS